MKTVLTGDCRVLLPKFPENYFDAVVTDPPYELGFMGKDWDKAGVSFQPETWREVLRVLKPGGHLLAFAGTRTYHRIVVAIEDAGFEIRDMVSWMYGQGFPKSMNVGKAIDKAAGANRVACGDFAPDSLHPDKEDRDVCTTCFFREVDHAVGDHQGTVDFGMKNRCGKCDKPFFSANPCKCPKPPAVTSEAAQWEGWGTALKPAQEPIVLARKPFKGTVAANVLEHGTGALNIDGTRISADWVNEPGRGEGWLKSGKQDIPDGTWQGPGVKRDGSTVADRVNPQGRFPANVILTHHPECEELGTKKVKGSNTKPSDIGRGREGKNFTHGIYGGKESKVTVSHTDEDGMETVEAWDCHESCPMRLLDGQTGKRPDAGYGDSGGASRFFYNAKASKSEREKGLKGRIPCTTCQKLSSDFHVIKDKDGKFTKRKCVRNPHPTVKPLALIQYLLDLVTPPNGKVLDPFTGSGTTGIAATLKGTPFIGMESDPDYANLARARIAAWKGAP